MQHNKHLILFTLLKALGLYVLWFILYDLWLNPMGTLDRWAINSISITASIVLKAMGYTLIPEPPPEEIIRTIGIDGTHGLWIGDPCNGLTIMALFAGFILILPGKWKQKIMYVALGIFVLHVANILRVVGLCLVLKHYPNSLEFNHTYSFTMVVYSIVFGLWLYWINTYSTLTLNTK
ncbi:MAG: exosortase family protein XrtF [Bacteroidia bacterium]|nr:exosortase family protein XrtF [Bacteroidia bacterium]